MCFCVRAPGRAQIFDRIKSLPDGLARLEKKLVPIKGDITLPGFGISQLDMDELASQVSVVFNSAATIRFSEPIEVAVRNNIYSVQQLVAVCDKLAKLEAVVHLSTAYSNCHKRDTIFEVFYEPPMGGDQIIEALQALRLIQGQLSPNWPAAAASSACLQSFKSERSRPQAPADDDLLAEFTQVALNRSNRPNTYTFTKAIAEHYLLELVKRRPNRYLGAQGIPVSIVRPSIVGGAWREPQVGFVDNYNGPTGAMLSLYTGSLQAMPGEGQRVADLVPIDMVANMILCCGWFLVHERNQPAAAAASVEQTSQPIKADQGVYIFNFVSGFRNPLLWHQVTDLIAELAYKYPSKYLVRLAGSYFIRAGKFYDFYDTINHKLPAKVHDWFRRKVLGQKLDKRSSWLAGALKIRQMTDALTPFTSNQWLLCDANVQALGDRLRPADRCVFPFDVSKIEWKAYLRNYLIGARVYTLGDEARSLPRALAKLRR